MTIVILLVILSHIIADTGILDKKVLKVNSIIKKINYENLSCNL